MEELRNQLRRQLLADPDVELKESLAWALPVTRLDVRFVRVKRLKMDILMKMLLLVLQEANIRRAANAAEMLLVEELFIADLLATMQRTGLIRMEPSGFALTLKGLEQLEAGIVEEEQEEEEAALLYSPAHDVYWPADKEPEPASEQLAPYRLAKNRKADKSRVQDALANWKNKEEGAGLQAVVSAVTAMTESGLLLPCLEFQLYNKEQDTRYVRVWNSLLGEWDKQLEQQIWEI